MIDSLRGTASFAVCCCHLAGTGLLKPATNYGWLGVYVFFVVSGFIIPYSLFRAGYTPTAYPKFLLKRVARLDPPYIISIILAVALHFISYQFRQFSGPPPSYSWKQILLHFGYLNSFFGGNWVIIVFWTLGIEFQYYVVMGLIYPLVVSRRRWTALVLLTLCALSVGRYDFPLHVQADQGGLVGHYAFVFVLGVLVFRYKVGLVRKGPFLLQTFLAVTGVAASCGLLIAIASLATSLAIAFLNFRSQVLEWLGAISYSLYLVHIPIGERVLGLGNRLFNDSYGRYGVAVAAVATSLAAAQVMYLSVELPSKRIASLIMYRHRQSRAKEPLLAEASS